MVGSQQPGLNPCVLLLVTATHWIRYPNLYPYLTTARNSARHMPPGVYEIHSVSTGLLLERFEVIGQGDLIPLWPDPEPPAARVAALLAA